MKATPFVLAAIALAVTSSCGPVPCSTCFNVSGIFVESVQGSTVDCADLRQILFTGSPGPVTITQTGSNLTLSGFAVMPGVLHQDLSATFGPVHAVAEPVDDMGNPDPTGQPEPGNLYLTGFFALGARQAQSFEGTYVFIADVDGCESDAKAQWSR